jgi:hypothetical protein
MVQIDVFQIRDLKLVDVDEIFVGHFLPTMIFFLVDEWFEYPD